MVKRRVYDDEKYIPFVTFSCYKRRKYLQSDRTKRMVIGHLGSRLSKHRRCKVSRETALPEVIPRRQPSPIDGSRTQRHHRSEHGG